MRVAALRPNSSLRVSYDYSALSDVGRIRDNNEDSVVVDTGSGVAVLADGMGGYTAGEVASALAADLISMEMVRWLQQAPDSAQPRDVRRAMEITVDNANRAIFDAARKHKAYAGMGTTVVVLAVFQDKLIVGHVGDSRAYRWRQGVLTQITHDHSLLQEQIDLGLITPQEAVHSINRNLVTRALGVEETVMTDVQELSVEDGDIYLMCSDGLNDLVTDPEIASVLGSEISLDTKVTKLVDLANAYGGRDNVSVVLARANTLS
jgi:protein phosphatase